MLDLPEDVSNKKYISNVPEPVGVSSNEVIPEVEFAHVAVPSNEMKEKVEKSEPKRTKLKTQKKSVFTKENLHKFIKYVKGKWFHFKTVQYPSIYAKFYDLYYFELVPYRPIDLALKGLIILTILIIVFIILMIILELLRLIF